MEVDAIQEIAEIKFSFPSPTDGYDLTTRSLDVRSHNYIAVTSTNIKDPDLLGNIQGSFNHFVGTGQVWALLAGVVIGYMFRSMTNYG